jgi:AcrR family transcriptional regulator
MANKKAPKKELSNIEHHIIDTAIELISQKGYSEVSSREIAREADISVGTLYYHFKEGKPEILMASANKLKELLNVEEIIEDGEVDDEEIRQFFFKDLDLARQLKPFLIAMEIEILKNPDHYIDQLDKYIMFEEIKPFKKFFEGIAGKEIKEENFIKILSIFKVLIRRHVIYRNIFGSDEDFMNMMVTIIRALA